MERPDIDLLRSALSALIWLKTNIPRFWLPFLILGRSSFRLMLQRPTSVGRRRRVGRASRWVSSRPFDIDPRPFAVSWIEDPKLPASLLRVGRIPKVIQCRSGNSRLDVLSNLFQTRLTMSMTSRGPDSMLAFPLNLILPPSATAPFLFPAAPP